MPHIQYPLHIAPAKGMILQKLVTKKPERTTILSQYNFYLNEKP